MASKLSVGVIGCGTISRMYVPNLVNRFGDVVRVAACCDLIRERAEERARDNGVPKVLTNEQLLADDEIELVLNLTPAPVHYEVSKTILAAGKHLYSEKPLALSMENGRELVRMAERRGLRLSCAPDTLLGSGVQTARKVLDAGGIGEPVAAHGFVAVGGRGENYYVTFRGPLLDLCPYHIGALILLFGPVTRVTGAVRPSRFFPEGHAAHTTDAPANAALVLEFGDRGPLVTLNATSETTGYLPFLKVYGTDAVMTCTDPNMFWGTTLLHKAGEKEAAEVPQAFGFSENSRGIGVADMALAIAQGKPHRLGAELALHTLEVMLATIESATTGRRVALTTTCDRPPPMPELAGQQSGAF